jgi:AcrR family transcriptional regulator
MLPLKINWSTTQMKRQRLAPTTRKSQILDAAMALAAEIGYQKVTREAIAVRAGCAPGLVSVYFGNMNDLRRSIISAAIARRDLKVLAQGLAAGESKAKRAPEELKQQAVQLLMAE